MDLFSARLTRLSTQRIIRGFVALLVTSVMFWCLISGDDSRPKPSYRRSEGITLAPRATAKMQTSGEVAGLVLGIILGVSAVGMIVWLFCRANRREAYLSYGPSDNTAETRWWSGGDFPALPTEHNRHYAVEAPIGHFQRTSAGEPVSGRRFDIGDDLQHWSYTGRPALQFPPLAELPSTGSRREATLPIPGLFGALEEFEPAGSPILFWKPTEMERDLASRISLDEAPSMAIPTPMKQASLKSSEHDPVFKLSSPDLERKANPEPPDSSDVAVALPVLAHIATHHTSPQPSLISEAVPKRPSLESAERSPEEDGVTATSSQFPCPEPSCSRTFSKQYKLNHHMRYHAKSKQCPTCSKSFGTVTHLERHVNSAHSSTRRYHCTVETCKYSKTVGGDAVFFSRKDNWRRHMKDRHGLT